METLVLKEKSVSSVKLHPTVLFSILDQYLRRSPDLSWVTGTLMGTVKNGVVEVTSCFPVRLKQKLSEEGPLWVPDYFRMMHDLHRKANKTEEIVGWFATLDADKIAEDFPLSIHEAYSKECSQPVFLTVDTTLKVNQLRVQAYVEIENLLLSQRMTQLLQVKLDMAVAPSERVGLSAIARETDVTQRRTPEKGGVASDLDALESSIVKLRKLLDQASKYVDDVVADRRKGDLSVGRQIADALSAVPKLAPETLHKVFNTSLQDLLMVVYLTNITRTQIAIAEKLPMLRSAQNQISSLFRSRVANINL